MFSRTHATGGTFQGGITMQRDLDERIEAALAGNATLRDVSKAARKWLSKTFLESPLKPLKNFLNGTWLEHPLHPVITDIPVGAWTTAMVLDLATLAFGEHKLGKASGIAIGLGTLGAGASIASGLMDYTDTDPPEDTVVLTHGLVNVTATLLFATSYLLRQRNGWRTEPSHVALSALGYTAVVIGGFLGGSLIYRHGVMVNRNAHREQPKEFTRVIALEELEENVPTRIELKGEPILLVRRGEQVYAVGAVCSHYGAPMEQGRLHGDSIECPWHYSVYSIKDGNYQRGPTTSPLPWYETRVLNGQVQVRLVTQQN
jgi:nitrite reductase/ring-hydroxylating ferredoxin subunit/uncharacterized membrane protein